jgi:hypothetical protein
MKTLFAAVIAMGMAFTSMALTSMALTNVAMAQDGAQFAKSKNLKPKKVRAVRRVDERVQSYSGGSTARRDYIPEVGIDHSNAKM